MSLYTELRDAGCTLDSHYSDLYVRDTVLAQEIIRGYHDANGWPCKPFARFTSPVDGMRWIDLPFMYDPFWEAHRHANSAS